MKPFRMVWYLAAFAASWSGVRAQTPTPAGGNTVVAPAGAVPLTSAQPDVAAAASATEWSVGIAGQQALNDGIPSMAIEFFRQALTQPGLSASAKDALNLDLVTACLAQGQVTDASAALQAVVNTSTPGYALRAALLAARMDNWTEAAAQIAKVAPGNLPEADQPWYYTVQALLAEQRQDAPAALAAWQNASDRAATPLQREQFEASRFRAQLYLTGAATPDSAEALRQSTEKYKYQAVGAPFAILYAVALDRLDQHPLAMSVVNEWLNALPVDDVADKDQLRLLLALLDLEVPANSDTARDQGVLLQVLQDSAGGTGHNALVTTQEIALALLEQNQQLTGDRKGLRDALDQLTAAQPQHPLLEQILLLQAQLSVGLGQLDAAAKYANQLLSKFPRPVSGADPAPPARDPLFEDALRLLAYAAAHSQPPQYGNAANYLIQLRDLLPPGPERTPLLGLLADVYFLKQDYGDAADLYKLLITDPAPPAPRGALLVRAVQSEISAGQLDAAIACLNDTATLPDIDPLDRWKAEWNVLKALRDNGREQDAFDRLKKLLNPAAGAPALPEELRVRLRWLAASLAVDVHDPAAADDAKAFQQEVAGLPANGQPWLDNDPDQPHLRDDLAANALLLLGEAAYLDNKPDDGKNSFDQLRKNYDQSDASMESRFFEASILDEQSRIAEAEQLMNDLADKYADSSYAPLALYRAGVYAMKRGDVNQAIDIFGKFIERYPNDNLIYQARLQQARLYSKNLDFESARRGFEFLLQNYPNNPDSDETEISLADCLVSLAGQPNATASARKDAIAALESLVGREDVPVEARVEAGYKWGFLLENGVGQAAPDPDGASRVFYTMKNRFFDNPDTAAELARSVTGRYWMACCLQALEGILETEHKDIEAQQVYEMMKKYNLPGATAPVTPAAPAVAPPAPSVTPATPAAAINSTAAP